MADQPADDQNQPGSAPDGDPTYIPPANPNEIRPEVKTRTYSTEQEITSITNIQIPNFEILEELRRGGMGVVYQARQIQLDRIVALKMILAGTHAGTEDLARFRTEAEAVARVQHPGIVQIYEIGEHQGVPFICLEFCSGGTLENRLSNTPMQPIEAVNLVRKLAQAIQAAHEANVIHRDLKPANVLLDPKGTPKITDFGLAKKLDESGQTKSGRVMGTPFEKG